MLFLQYKTKSGEKLHTALMFAIIAFKIFQGNALENFNNSKTAF